MDAETKNAHDYLDLGFDDKFAFQVDGVISQNESERLITFTEEMGFRDAAPGIQTPPGMRQNTTVHWMVHPKDAELLYSRIASFVPDTLEGRDSMGR